MTTPALSIGRCAIEGCGSERVARGWCTKHYQRWHKHGDPATVKPPGGGPTPMTPEERAASFWSRVDVGHPLGCWLWTGAGNRYGQYGGTSAHRVAFELLRGTDPGELTLDHLCSNPRCVNPDHLEPVAQRENLMRSKVAQAAVNARKTCCKRGHRLAGDNLYEHGGRRHCRACRSARDRRVRA